MVNVLVENKTQKPSSGNKTASILSVVELVKLFRIFSRNKARVTRKISSVNSISTNIFTIRIILPFVATINTIPLKSLFISSFSELRILIKVSTSFSMWKMICKRTFCFPTQNTLSLYKCCSIYKYADLTKTNRLTILI